MINSKPRIVFLDYVVELDKPGRTGLSDIVWDLSSELVELGFDVHVVAPYPQELAPDQRIRVHTIKVPPTGYRWFVGHLWLCKRMTDVAYRLNPDIVHAPEYVSTAVYNTLYPSRESLQVLTVPGNIFHRLKSDRKPNTDSNKSTLRVLTVPGNIFHKLRHKRGNPYSFFFTQCLKWAARKSATSGTQVIAISREMKRAWEDTGSPSNLTPWIPLGTNPHRFHYVENAREKLGIPEDSTLLLYVGRFSREKAIVEMVETVARCQDSLRKGKVRVQLFGKGPLTAKVTEVIQHNKVGDIVIQSAWVAQADLPAWYSAADALLLPSFTEGFARVLPEAMICGTPVIGSRITGTEDVVFPGQTGLLFEAADFDKFQQILELVARDPEILRRMRPTVKSYAEANLTWPSITRRIVTEVYGFKPVMASA